MWLLSWEWSFFSNFWVNFLKMVVGQRSSVENKAFLQVMQHGSPPPLFLLKDRGIGRKWNGGRRRSHCSGKLKEELSLLACLFSHAYWILLCEGPYGREEGGSFPLFNIPLQAWLYLSCFSSKGGGGWSGVPVHLHFKHFQGWLRILSFIQTGLSTSCFPPHVCQVNKLSVT